MRLTQKRGQYFGERHWKRALLYSELPFLTILLSWRNRFARDCLQATNPQFSAPLMKTASSGLSES